MDVRIYQAYYLKEQRSDLDQAFQPFDWTANPDPRLREIAIFRAFHDRGLHRSADVSGVMSPKFGSKTMMPGRAFIDFIAENPGYDAYFVNPFPQIAYYSFNQWEQGEQAHPGLVDRAQRLLDHCGIALRIDDFPRVASDKLLYCNYWAGTPSFWDRYMGFINRLHDAIMHEMAAGERNRYFEMTFHSQPTEFFPFIFERMFTTYLFLHPETRALPFRHAEEHVARCCFHEFELEIVRSMRIVIDGWDLEGVFTPDRRQTFRALNDLFACYNRLYFKIYGDPLEMRARPDPATQE